MEETRWQAREFQIECDVCREGVGFPPLRFEFVGHYGARREGSPRPAPDSADGLRACSIHPRKWTTSWLFKVRTIETLSISVDSRGTEHWRDIARFGLTGHRGPSGALVLLEVERVHVTDRAGRLRQRCSTRAVPLGFDLPAALNPVRPDAVSRKRAEHAEGSEFQRVAPR